MQTAPVDLCKMSPIFWIPKNRNIFNKIGEALDLIKHSDILS